MIPDNKYSIIKDSMVKKPYTKKKVQLKKFK